MEASEERLESEDAIRAQITEQRESLGHVQGLIAEDPHDPELSELAEGLKDSINDLEELLLHFEKHRAGHGGVVVGEQCRFRHLDGRWHWGVVEHVAQNAVQMRFQHPTRAHMLSGALVEPGLIKPRRTDSASSSRRPIGSRVIAREREYSLWKAAELVAWDGDSQTVVFCDSGIMQQLPASAVAPSAYASDSEDISEAPEEGFWPIERGSGESEDEDDSDEDRRLSGAAASSLEAATQGGVQTETVAFGSWEGHTRGIGSKLMIGMGYVKGAALGQQPGAIVEPVQVQLFRPQAGLGSEGSRLGNATSARKRKRSGRRRRQADSAFREREARRDAEWQVEKETGAAGVFALVNKRLGDGGEAAKLLRAADHRHALRLSSNGNGAFERTTQSQAAAPVHNRLSLMAGQDGVAAAKAKVATLQEMAARNKKDTTMLKQIVAKLATAEAEVQALENSQVSSMAALHSKEKHRKWMKF